MSNSPSKKKKPVVRTTGVLDFLQKTSRSQLEQLYVEPTYGRFVCKSIFQNLNSVSQQIVLRLSCTGNTFPRAGVKVWTSISDSAHEALLSELHQWAIIQDYDEESKVVSLTAPFAKGLRSSLTALEPSPWRPLEDVQIAALEQEAKAKSQPPVTSEFLEKYTQKVWDSVLHFLVGSTDHEEPHPAMKEFLLQTGLMQNDPDYKGKDPEQAPLVITEAGYEFMLQDNHRQVWHFVVQYLKSLDEHEKGTELRKECLLLLIAISFANVGRAYLASSLSKTCRIVIKVLSHFGLLYIRKIGKATIFYPTRIAMQLVGTPTVSNTSVFALTSKALSNSLSDPKPQGSSHLAIIVQTNFQLCAYTTSELHVSMLGLFCDISTIRRLPNVVFMHITRNSVKWAFNLGITAHQILRFLEKHTHPKLRTVNVNTGDTAVPSNVVDQIWLWEREASRVQFTKVYQHRCVMGGEEFKAVRKYADKVNALAWSSDRQLLIDYRFVDKIQEFASKWRAKAVQQQDS